MNVPDLRIEDATLRQWALADAPTLVAAWHDAAIAEWNPVPGSPTLGTAEKWISGAPSRASELSSIDWVIDSTSGDVMGAARPARIVGEVGLSGFNDQHRGAFIGYWLLPAGRGQGVATAAITAVTAWAHESLSLDMVVARCHQNNVASQKVAARAGYQIEGTDSTGHQLWISRTRGA